MTEVKELKYLGFIIASSASNVPNILDRKKKLTSTPNTIMKMTTGLGSHTLEASLIYFNSLLRASLLYACEAYVNLSEKEYRLIESTEENCLLKFLDSGSQCPRSILYLELGQIPARFQIKKLMLNYLQYLLQEDENTLMSKFFIAQCQNPIKNDWVSNIHSVKNEIDLDLTFEEIRKMKIQKYQNIVDSKIKIAAFIYLKSKIKSKGKEIIYGDQLTCQNYLLPNTILTFKEQKSIFSFRSRSNKLTYNYPGNKEKELCECGVNITNEHLYNCLMLNQGKIVEDNYEQIFNGTLSEQKQVLNILEQNMNKHEDYALARI